MRNKHTHAFTLIELLIAMTITSIIILAVHGTYKQTSFMLERVEENAQLYHQINTVTEILRTEINSIYIPNSTNQQETNSNQANKNKDIFILSGSTLTFYTLNSLNSKSSRYAKPSKVTYSSNGEKLTRTELLTAGTKTIEIPAINGIETNTNTTFDVPKITFEAYAENPQTKQYSWLKDFKSKDSLPKAIAINFTNSKTKNTEQFETKLVITIAPEK